MIIHDFFKELKAPLISQNLKETLFILFLSYMGPNYNLFIYPRQDLFRIETTKGNLFNFIVKENIVYLQDEKGLKEVDMDKVLHHFSFCTNGEDLIFDYFFEFYHNFNKIEIKTITSKRSFRFYTLSGFDFSFNIDLQGKVGIFLTNFSKLVYLTKFNSSREAIDFLKAVNEQNLDPK